MMRNFLAAIAFLFACSYAGADPYTIPYPAPSTDAHSTVTLGGTFQSLFASGISRKGCYVQNPKNATEDLFVYFGAIGSATTAGSVDLQPGSAVNCNVGPIVLDDQVSVTATTTGHAFIAYSQ